MPPDFATPLSITTTARVSRAPDGKPQDGWVSRHLNRPISRLVTRLLLRFPITPNAWTLSITPLPIVGAYLIAQGDYAASILATLLYQLYSILDGCDGEIARAKHLESAFGQRLDRWCDIGGSILLVVAAGMGASKGVGGYFIEGLIGAALIFSNELWLARREGLPAPVAADSIEEITYTRHRHLVSDSGLLFFGEGFARFLLQLTKRDVGILIFVLLALLHQVPWIVHLLTGTAAITLALSVRALSKTR